MLIILILYQTEVWGVIAPFQCQVMKKVPVFYLKTLLSTVGVTITHLGAILFSNKGSQLSLFYYSETEWKL